MNEHYEKIKGVLLLGFVEYLDENRLPGKMNLSNMEIADIKNAFDKQDWAKLARYAEKSLTFVPNK